jgi:hypothetical protein
VSSVRKPPKAAEETLLESEQAILDKALREVLHVVHKAYAGFD